MPITVEELQAHLQQLHNQMNKIQADKNTTEEISSISTLVNAAPAPPTFSFKKEDWQEWITHFERYRIATKMANVDEKIQINNMLLHMGPEVTRLLQTLQRAEDSFKKYDELKTFLDNYFVGTANVIYARAKFNLRKQKEDETAQEYISTIIELAKQCKYRDLENELVRDKLVVGIRDEKLSEKLQLDGTLTLEKAIETITQAERVKNENAELRNGNETVNRINKFKQSKKRLDNKQQTPKCTRCGAQLGHSRNACPAKNQKCKKCKRIGH